MRKLNMQEIDKALAFLPGTYAVCSLGESFKTLRYSSDIPGLLGYSDEQFRAKIKDGLEALIGQDENEALKRNTKRLTGQDGSLEFVYHVKRSDGEPFNVQTVAKCPGELDGEPLIIASFCFLRDDAELEHNMIDRISNSEFDYVAIIDIKSGLIHFRNIKSSSFIAPPSDLSDYSTLLSTCLGRAMDSEDYASALSALSLPRVRGELGQKDSYVYSASVHDADGNKRRKQYKFSYLDSNHDKVLFVRSDVTESFAKEQEIEDRLVESADQLKIALAAAKQASSAKSNFLSRMSHEIRTPMNAIIGMSTLAAQAVGNDEKISDCISKIGISARYLLSLINDILDMSRIESGKMLLKNEKFDFKDFISAVNGIIYNQAAAKGLEYECIVSNEVDEAYFGDPMKLQQVLINILGNAVKYTTKGKVSFEVQQVSRKSNLSTLRFIVNDTGCGIRDSDLDRIFEPFEQGDSSTTTPFGGTGLGLAITKSLVELMGGFIRVRSIVGVGSEFTVEIPLTVDESAIAAPHLDASFEKLHTLVVDDDPIVCESAVSTLKEIGMTGEWVMSGKEALVRVTEHFENKNNYDFVLIDWKMPDMDGIETTRGIRRIVGPDVTIIIISAYDWAAIESEAKAAGANLLITKPLFKSTLISAFQKARGQSEENQPRKVDYNFSGKRILVAEDNQINSEIARGLLESKGFSVDLAPNGLKAMEMFISNPVHYYDAILMDVRMPMMDGLQATVNIRHWSKEDAKTVPIIAMTANAFDEDVEKSKAAGMNAHLAKPIEPELLYRTLYHMIYTGDED